MTFYLIRQERRSTTLIKSVQSYCFVFGIAFTYQKSLSARHVSFINCGLFYNVVLKTDSYRNTEFSINAVFKRSVSN